MITPFVYGKLATGVEFTDRKDETQRLVGNFRASINTIIISPRRWGKSSLVQRVAEKVIGKDLHLCFIDMFNIRKEEEFYRVLSEKVIKETATKWNDLAANVSKYFKHFVPKISFSPSPGSDIEIGLNWTNVKDQPEEILNLAENIARQNSYRLVICIDEFQNISGFEDPLAFQKKLRAHWQHHKNVSYCLYGSKRHMMLDVFASPGMPFYKFGDLMFLEKISKVHWTSYILQRFSDTGKSIAPDLAGLIASLADNHPYYVQQIAQLSWLRTKKECTEIIIHEATDALINQLDLLFLSITESLSRTQVNFLRAMIEEVEHVSSKKSLIYYDLGTSANVNRIKKALLAKEIIDTHGNGIYFNDPMYRLWLKNYYFS